MRVISIDPGYANFGLAVVDIKEGAKKKSLLRVIYSANIRVGSAFHPLKFSDRLWPELEQVYATHGPFEGASSETPTFIMKRVRTTALIWHATGIFRAWCTHRGIRFRHHTPVQLKKFAAHIVGKPFNRKKMMKKSEIGKMVKDLLGEKRGSNHENDAVLAAMACYGFNGMPE